MKISIFAGLREALGLLGVDGVMLTFCTGFGRGAVSYRRCLAV